jgi:cytochrome bd-type quinol oxidase subunit 1
MNELYYPINDFEPLMKGLVLGGMGIFHVFLAQFAIGGGLLACWLEWLYGTGRSTISREFIDRYFKILVLISFVLGAVTGVAMWFTTIQISPRTIGLMVQEFHWIWAIEWTFFCLEVVAGYCFYRCGSRLDHRGRLSLLITYSVAAWFSLFWINGILAWQLTPGEWLQSSSIPVFCHHSFFARLHL